MTKSINECTVFNGLPRLADHHQNSIFHHHIAHPYLFIRGCVMDYMVFFFFLLQKYNHPICVVSCLVSKIWVTGHAIGLSRIFKDGSSPKHFWRSTSLVLVVGRYRIPFGLFSSGAESSASSLTYICMLIWHTCFMPDALPEITPMSCDPCDWIDPLCLNSYG